MDRKKFLAVILARGGSKRLPHKNILKLGKKPMIAWSIEAAMKSKYVDKIIVSSDDEEILKISQNLGAGVLKRPEYLATDFSSSMDAILHAIESFPEYAYIILLQPTSPLRNENHIDEAVEFLLKKDADAVISVCETDHSPAWNNTLPENKNMKNFLNKEIKNKRSQDLDKYYRVNGAIYICKKNKLLEEKTFFLEDNIYAYEMDKISSIDIDEQIDYEFAKFCLEKNIKSK